MHSKSVTHEELLAGNPAYAAHLAEKERLAEEKKQINQENSLICRYNNLCFCLGLAITYSPVVVVLAMSSTDFSTPHGQSILIKLALLPVTGILFMTFCLVRMESKNWVVAWGRVLKWLVLVGLMAIPATPLLNKLP